MINTAKITNFKRRLQIAGLFPGDKTIEFVANRKTKKVFWMQNGTTRYFTTLPISHFNTVKKAYLKDHKAVEFISTIHEHITDQVELYTYYMFGDLDSTPDIENGKLSRSENFRDSENCPSLLWESKQMTIDNYILTPRDLVMIDMMAQDYKDAVIAQAIGICHSHFDTVKRNLFTHTNTQTKTALMLKAQAQKVI